MTNSFKVDSKGIVIGLIVATIAFVVYANTLDNGFVDDDFSVILSNPVMKGPVLSVFSVIDTTGESQLLPFYRPLTYLTFLVEGRIHGFNPIFMHLINVLLHAVNVFLVYYLALSLMGNSSAALLAGLLFAVHPLNVEAVNYLSGGRNTMLACFFSLVACLVHRKSIIEKNILFALTGSVFFLAGTLSKEAAVMVLPFIVALEIMALRDNSGSSRFGAVRRLLPYAAAVIAYLMLRQTTLERFGIQAGILPGITTQLIRDMYAVPGLADRLFNNIYIIPKYFLSIVWPLSPVPFDGVPPDLHVLALPLSFVWLCIIGIVGWLVIRRKSRTTLFGLLWFLAFWLPVSGLFFFSNIVLAERYLYIPAIGIWLVAAEQLSRLFPADIAVRRWVEIVALLLLLVLAGLTVNSNFYWKDDITLFSRIVLKDPESPYGHVKLGNAYFRDRKPENLMSAEKEFEKALELEPDTQSADTPLGYIRFVRGDYEGAVYHYSKALGFWPLNDEARINRAIANEKLGRYNEALADYKFYLKFSRADAIPGARRYAEERARELSGRLNHNGLEGRRVND